MRQSSYWFQGSAKLTTMDDIWREQVELQNQECSTDSQRNPIDNAVIDLSLGTIFFFGVKKLYPFLIDKLIYMVPLYTVTPLMQRKLGGEMV